MARGRGRCHLSNNIPNSHCMKYARIRDEKYAKIRDEKYARIRDEKYAKIRDEKYAKIRDEKYARIRVFRTESEILVKTHILVYFIQ